MKYLARIVNFAPEGEPEHPVLQLVESSKVFEFSQIKWIRENAFTIKAVNLVDKDLNQEPIQHVLGQMNHQCEVMIDANNIVTLLYFYDANFA